jgi:methyltransferase family protein
MPSGCLPDGLSEWTCGVSRTTAATTSAITPANIETTGVAGRVELHTAEMTELPFADDSVDLVTNALAIHNIPIPTSAARYRTLDETLGVPCPGGCRRIGEPWWRFASERRGLLVRVGFR